MNLNFDSQQLAFRDELRAFLRDHLPADIRTRMRDGDHSHIREDISDWQKILHRQGWGAPAWPKEFGGPGWSKPQQYIFDVECALADAPEQLAFGLKMVGPVIMRYGNAEQQQRFLPRIVAADDWWCQGYSEPGSGSDLASLQMSAVEDGDDFVCNGHKIWTTHANRANWIFCLVRTAKESIPQKGITFLLIDMSTPGVSVKPIVSLSGEHIQNEVFFTDVRVPKANVVGRVGDGWTVAKYLMQFERGGSAYAPGMNVRLRKIRAMAEAELDGSGARLIDDPSFARKLADAAIRIDTLDAVELRLMSRLSNGEAPGAESSLTKTVGTELSQHLTELALEAAGHYGLPYQPHAVSPGGPTPGFTPPADGFVAGPAHSLTVTSKYFNDRAGSIYAGTNEIQRNIMSKAVLGV